MTKINFNRLKKIFVRLKKIFNHKKKKNLMNLFLNRAIIQKHSDRFAEKDETGTYDIAVDDRRDPLWRTG